MLLAFQNEKRCIRQWMLVVTPTVASASRRRSGPFWALAFLLAMAFFLGGGSRSDIASLIVLRPAAALLLGYGIWGLTRQHIADHRILLCFAGATVGLVLVQLVPLPPAVWTLLPGRDLIVAIDNAAGLGLVWRPLSMVPSGTWNAFFSLIPPLGALVLAIRLTTEECWGLLPVIIAIGVVSALLALLQLGASVDGGLYFYKQTNRGSAVGLFANRNHHAVFLAALLPMLAAYASRDAPSSLDHPLRAVLALTIGVFFVVLILVIGSRAGLLIMLVALPSVPFFYRLSRSQRHSGITRSLLWAVPPVFLVAALGALTHEMGKALAFERLFAQPVDAEVRYSAWVNVLGLAWHYFPAGTGFGSFAEVFQVDEPHELLATTIFNHAHNDWIELALTGGIAACVLLTMAVIALGMRFVTACRSPRDTDAMVFLGIWVMVLFALASLSDYPLRVPSIACLCAVTLAWIGQKPARSIGKKAFDRDGYLSKQELNTRGSVANA